MTSPTRRPSAAVPTDNWSYAELVGLLERLSEQEAAVLWLVYFQSRTLSDVAAELRIDVGTVTALVARGLRHVAEHLLNPRSPVAFDETRHDDPVQVV